MKVGSKEKDIEKYLKKEMKRLGGIAYKFTSPGRRSVPDRLCVLPGGVVAFVECKATGEDLSEAQEREAKRLRDLDQWVFMVDRASEVNKMINKLKEVI